MYLEVKNIKKSYGKEIVGFVDAKNIKKKSAKGFKR